MTALVGADEAEHGAVYARRADTVWIECGGSVDMFSELDGTGSRVQVWKEC